MPDAAVTVPADHAGLFQREARFTLETAASDLEEVLKFDREGRRKAQPGEVDRGLDRARYAERLFAQVEDKAGELRIEGERAALSVTLQGCLLTAGERLHGACESSAGIRGLADVRLAIAEVELWLGMLESVEEEA